MVGVPALNVGVEESEEDHGGGHKVHVKTEDDAGMTPRPAALDAAGGFGGAKQDHGAGHEEPEGGAIVGEVRDPEREEHAGDNQQVAAKEGAAARMKDFVRHSV